MNVENHPTNSRPRPQAVPEVVSLSPRQNARLASDSDVRRPIAPKEGVSASADAVHPVRKSAAINPQVIVEVAPQKSTVAASATRGKQIIVEMSPNVTPLHPKVSARGKVAPTLDAGRRAISGQVIVEVSPDIQSTTASFHQTDRGRVAPTLGASRRAISGQVIVEVSPDIPSTSVRNAINPEIAPDVKPNFAASAGKERTFTKKAIQPEISPDVSPAIAASSRRGRAVVPEMAPDLRPLISKAN